MYTVREFAEKRINSGIFARFVLFLSGIGHLQAVLRGFFKKNRKSLSDKYKSRYSILSKELKITRKNPTAHLQSGYPFATLANVLSPELPHLKPNSFC